MAYRPLKNLTLPDSAAAVYEDWLGEIEDRLKNPKCDRYTLCRDVLFDLYFPGHGDYEDLLHDPGASNGVRAALLALDPHNVTLEPEYYHEGNVEQYQQVKPLLWLWQSFDRSPLGGGNVDVGVQLRRILAQHIFARCGENFKCFQFVEFSYGFKIEVGDDVVVHRHVLLDDRGGIVLGNRVSIADYSNVYSHTHALADQADVTNKQTVLEDGVRLAYHATVLAGVRVGEEAMVGSGAVVAKDVPPWHLSLGVPAKPIRLKPNAPLEFRADP
ncbi:MAG: acyltransferase [Gemmatimonadota bacterium]|nr:MAG: acyltransferase [Gemmatimonadota bacterium]